jgi:hypothetical protein
MSSDSKISFSKEFLEKLFQSSEFLDKMSVDKPTLDKPILNKPNDSVENVSTKYIGIIPNMLKSVEPIRGNLTETYSLEKENLLDLTVLSNQFKSWSNYFGGRMIDQESARRIVTSMCADICSGEINVDECDEKELLELQKLTEEEESNFYNSNRYFSYIPTAHLGKTKFQVAREYIDNRLTFLQNPYYFHHVSPTILKEDEEENGFKLYNVDVNLYTYSSFKDLVQLMATPDSLDVSNLSDTGYKLWNKKMSNVACSDWNKQDEHGVCYGGYWAEPKDSQEYKNAWHLSFERSCKCMWNLPFSQAILLKTIEIGCASRRESVRYSNFICVWIMRKLKAMAETKNQVETIIHNTLGGDAGNMTRIVSSYYHDDDFSSVVFPKAREKITF